MFSTFLCCWSLQSHDCTAFLGSLLLRGGMSDQKVDKQCPMSNRAGKCIPCLCALLSLIPTGQSYAGQPAALRHLQSSTSQLLSSGPSSYSPPPHTISIPHTGCQSCQLLCTVGIYFPIRDYPPPRILCCAGRRTVHKRKTECRSGHFCSFVATSCYWREGWGSV